jgi:uncharacterized membrane protein affecting hemolysin expression
MQYLIILYFLSILLAYFKGRRDGKASYENKVTKNINQLRADYAKTNNSIDDVSSRLRDNTY